MGRLSHDPFIQHFSHHHQLQLTQTLTPTTPFCSGCNRQSSGWMYTCRPCNFSLHLSCSQMPQLINHPSHPLHPLSLLPKPLYPGGVFKCDACGHQGHGFSYHCNNCDFDLHILCASKPLYVTHHAHACRLSLSFSPPYQAKGFSCDICRKFGANHWLYHCGNCEFDAHLDCASNTHQIQHSISFPGGNYHNGVMNQQQFVHSQSMGGMQMQSNNYQQFQQQQQQPCLSGNSLMNAAVQGFVEGAAQQVGQNFVQNMMTGGSILDPGNNGGMVFDFGDSSMVGDSSGEAQS
ncbi:uncharacterized protein LOC116122164 [Pistacia vera]|uniref:uncharacterized protein LOC116122164 n=1 Tax=Pistacia vera TaxID=55513 RepID=UPI001262D31B|nr:uncharacterized protein LOC116122164 [Pistacia vera]